MVSLDLCCLSDAEVAVSLTLIMNFLFEADFLVGKKLLLPSFHDCLKERGTVQMLTIGREAAIEVQVRYIIIYLRFEKTAITLNLAC